MMIKNNSIRLSIDCFMYIICIWNNNATLVCERKLRNHYGSLGRCHSVVHRCPERPPSDSGSPPGARSENGCGENGRCHTTVDRVANGTRPHRQEATESRREGRCHETRKSRIDRVPSTSVAYNRQKCALAIVPRTWIVIANNLLSQDGATPLFKAAHKGHTAVIGELLKYRPSLGVLPVSEN